MMLRRSFGTIHEGHCPNEWNVEMLFDWIAGQTDWQSKGYHAAAFALEETKEGNLHIQFYIEHDRKRVSTLARDLLVTTPAVFDVVRDAQGSWDYCSGTGRHEGKEAHGRFTFGTPILYGGTASADLKALVDLIIEGNDLPSIMRAYPYAYCVHRMRLVSFYDDWHWTGTAPATLIVRPTDEG